MHKMHGYKIQYQLQLDLHAAQAQVKNHACMRAIQDVADY